MLPRCVLRILFNFLLLLPIFVELVLCGSNGIRHNHGRHRHISRNHNYDKLYYGQNQVHSLKPLDVRQVYRTYQKGSARIPNQGATVHVPASYAPKKMYRGRIATSVLERKPSHRLGFGQRNLFNNKHKKRGEWEISHDEPVKKNETPCAKCPIDKAVIAKRGSITTIMERLPVTPCFPWSNVDDVIQDVMLGPRPGHILSEGTHSLVTRLIHDNHPIATCHVMYNVIVRKCEALEPEGLVQIDCPLGEAWGASCYFSCPDGYQLIGENTTECNDQLEWSESIPFCAVSTSCTVPVAPENGHMTCRTPHHRPIKSQNALPDGTVCHFRCSNGFHVPPSQQQLVTVQCFAGQWNSTQDPTCIETDVLNEPQNELQDNTSHHLLTSPRIARKHCPKSMCQNGGKCFIILGEPICMCEYGFTGVTCTELLNENSLN